MCSRCPSHSLRSIMFTFPKILFFKIGFLILKDISSDRRPAEFSFCAMGGEYFRYLYRKPEKKFGEAEKQQYKKALPELIGCYEKWRLRKLPSVLENIREVVNRNSARKKRPFANKSVDYCAG